MSNIPQTSLTLLQELAGNAHDSQWSRFYETYKGAIIGYVIANFPALEPDDILQETMRALADCLPTYQYVPDEKGHFHNFLMGIAKHKALDAIRKLKREAENFGRYSRDPSFRRLSPSAREAELRKWQEALKETAIQQLMASTDINANSRMIFQHVALMHERPDDVAEQFGTTRNNVDQIKNRMLKKIKELVLKLAKQNPFEN